MTTHAAAVRHFAPCWKIVALVLPAMVLVACGGGGGGQNVDDGGPTAITPLPSFSVVAGNQANRLTWPAVPGATAYNVYWSTTSGVGKTTGTKLAGVTSPYLHTGLTNGVTYFYVVTYDSAAGESDVPAQLAAMPRSTGATTPVPVFAAGADGRAEVRWNGVSGATSYNVYYKTASGVTTADGKLTDVTSPAVVTGLNNGTPVYLAVTAVTGSGESTLSAEVATIPYVAEPLRPTGMTVTPGNAQVTLAWDAAPGATSYEVFWDLSAGVTDADSKVEVSGTTWTHTALTNGIRYFYAVRAKNAQGVSVLSREVAAVPGATTPLTGRAASHAVILSWPEVTGATSYTLYSNASGTTQPIANVTSPYTHAGLTAGTTVTYSITATVGGVESARSTEVRVTPYGAVPATPRRLITRVGHGQVSVEVYPETPGLRYNIYWNTGGGVTTSDQVIANVTLPHTQVGLANGTTYHYRIAELNAEGASGLSPENRVTPGDTLIADITLSDAALQGCVSAAANAFGWLHAHQVIYTDCTEQGVASLAGIDQFPNLLELYLNDNSSLAGTDALDGLRNLTWLEIGGNGISDLSLLASHFNLVYLWANDSGVTSLAPLQDLKALQQLNVRDNAFTDLTPLSNLDRLTDLWLGHDASTPGSISDLTPLAGLTSLVDLRVDHNRVPDLDDVAKLTKLQVLWLDHDPADANKITDLAPLANLAALTDLRLSNNALTSSTLAHLGGLARLETLVLSGNSQTLDVYALAGLSGLRTLDLSNIGLQQGHVASIGDLTGLRWLAMSGNPAVNDVSGLATLTALTDLFIQGNNVGSVAPLAGMTQLQNLDASGNAIVDVSPLAALVNLRWLNLGDNAIGGYTTGKVETLGELKQATYVGLYGNLGMSCTAVSNLQFQLGAAKVDLDGNPQTVDTPANTVNCTN